MGQVYKRTRYCGTREAKHAACSRTEIHCVSPVFLHNYFPQNKRPISSCLVRSAREKEKERKEKKN